MGRDPRGVVESYDHSTTFARAVSARCFCHHSAIRWRQRDSTAANGYSSQHSSCLFCLSYCWIHLDHIDVLLTDLVPSDTGIDRCRCRHKAASILPEYGLLCDDIRRPCIESWLLYTIYNRGKCPSGCRLRSPYNVRSRYTHRYVVWISG